MVLQWYLIPVAGQHIVAIMAFRSTNFFLFERSDFTISMFLFIHSSKHLSEPGPIDMQAYLWALNISIIELKVFSKLWGQHALQRILLNCKSFMEYITGSSEPAVAFQNIMVQHVWLRVLIDTIFLKIQEKYIFCFQMNRLNNLFWAGE